MLAKRDVAIVSDIAGTTRDVLDVPLDLGGFPVTVHDTAGLRETEEAIEAEGIRRARKAAERADLHLVLIDAASWPDVSRETEALLDDRSILVVNKVDRLPDHPAERGGVLFISALTGEGLDRLLSHLIDRLAAEFDRPGVDVPLLTRARHREALIECLASLERFLAAAGPLDLAAEDLRFAVRALGRITGRVDVEDFLDVIFRDFCIGK
jgi:tRNA modification GTPase